MTWRTRTRLSSHSAADFFCFKEMQELCCSRVSICILHIRLVTLQATLKRHVVTRCDDLRHTSRTNTPGEAPVLCYQSCHHHPKRVFCRATRTEYFDRIMAQHGRNKRGRAWA